MSRKAANTAAAPLRSHRIGYIRVSKDDQNPDLQRDAIAAAGCDHIYEEKITTGKAIKDRPELVNCLRALREGDRLVVWKLDRIARSTHELVSIANELRAKGVYIELLEPRYQFDDTPIGKMLYGMFSLFAEFERDQIRERTRAGLEAARARGRKGGRTNCLSEHQKREVRAALRNRAVTVREIADKYGVSRSTVYRALDGDAR